MLVSPTRSFASPHSRPLRGPLDGAHVLIAEDNLVNMEVATFHVEDLGGTFATAVNGALAVELARQQTFDFVLMDCQMPVMDGFEALRRIRALVPACPVRSAVIIAVTAADDLETQAQCAAAGFDGFLPKPFSAAQLLGVLTQIRSGLSIDNPTVKIEAALNAVKAASPLLDQCIFEAFVADFGEDTAQSLLGSFLKLLHESKAKYARAAVSQQTKELQSIAHKVAGAAGTVGAARLAALAREIQSLCKRNEFQWSGHAADFEDALSDTTITIEQLLAKDLLVSA